MMFYITLIQKSHDGRSNTGKVKAKGGNPMLLCLISHSTAQPTRSIPCMK